MFNLRVKRLRNRKMFRTVWLLGESILLYFNTWLFRDQYRGLVNFLSTSDLSQFFFKNTLRKAAFNLTPSISQGQSRSRFWKFVVTYFSSIIKTFKYHFHIKRIWGFFYHLVIWDNFWKKKIKHPYLYVLHLIYQDHHQILSQNMLRHTLLDSF